MRLQYADTERFDELVASAVRLTERRLDPALRYLVFVDFLDQGDRQLLGSEIEVAHRRLEAALGSERWNTYQDLISEISQIAAELLANTSYTVASYWSPTDRQRRSVVHTRARATPAQHEVHAYAYCFYALTLEGGRLRPPQTSLVHLISEAAKRKRGLTTAFRASTGASANGDVLYIPPLVHRLADQLGVTDAIEFELMSLPPEDLRAALTSVLRNDPERPWDKLAGFARRLLEKISGGVDALPLEMLRYLDAVGGFLGGYFFAAGQPVARAGACVVVVTQLLWRHVAGIDATQHMYTFPTAVGDTCCVLSVGRTAPLGTTERLALSSLARSLFVHPLLLDYAESERQATQSRQNNVFRRLLGHNFPKLFIKPGLNELERIGRLLEGSREEMALEVRDRVERLRVLFQHYESFAVTVMSSDRLREDFTRAPALFDLIVTVVPRLRTMFEHARGTLPSKTIRGRLVLEEVFAERVEIVGHETFVTEILFNILSNALVALNPEDVRADPARARLLLSVSLGEAYAEDRCDVHISLTDRARGFPRERLDEHAGLSEVIQHCGRDTLWSNLSSLVERCTFRHADEGHFGIGLLFCEAYLRSLEWHSQIGRRGRLLIAARENEGTTVTIVLPGGVPSSAQRLGA